ncbi:MAG: type VI secretion system tube protein Hcp [Acidobacteriia bacterium]|nr:type VI secretion system tube protein Hcp [Terriglobia bacterium]
MSARAKFPIRMQSQGRRQAQVRARRARRIAAAGIVVAALWLGMGTAASAQGGGYMRVMTPRGQMVGESTNAAHNGWIIFHSADVPSVSEIDALNRESSADSAPGSADAKTTGKNRKASDPHTAAPKLVRRPVVIVKEHDRSSMALVIAQTSHQVLPEVDIVLTTKSDEPTVTYKLTDASVISIRQSGTNEGTEAPLEQVRFNYAKIEVER